MTDTQQGTITTQDLEQIFDPEAHCHGWKKHSTGCPNEPVWRGVLPCCGESALFCDPCRETLRLRRARQEHAAKKAGRVLQLRCGFCKVRPVPGAVFTPA